ncbi:hypothetical protein FRC01_010017, partial [Tulasnella sp. 417]
MSKSSASIWRESREEVEPRVPDCPPDQSEPQWAYLLFSRDCSTCERTNIPHVDWYHRLRLCSRCGRAGVVLIIGPKAQNTFPHIADINMLLELLPHSNTGSSHTGKYYRMKTIEAIGAEWANIEKRGNEADIQEFKDRKKRETEYIMTHGTVCKTWDLDRTILKSKQREEVRDTRRDDLSTGITEQRWKTIRPELEALVNSVKDRRLRRERIETVDQRRALAENLVTHYQITPRIPPAFRPHLWDLVKDEAFQTIIHLPNEVSISATEFQPALDTIPDLVAKAAKEIQSNLLQ